MCRSARLGVTRDGGSAHPSHTHRNHYSDGGTATGSITLNYPTNGAATVASFDITLTSTQLAQPLPYGYGSSTVTMSGPSGQGPVRWFSLVDGPVGPNNTYGLVVYGSPTSCYPSCAMMEFWFDVPNSLITGPPPVAPVQFDPAPTDQGYDGAWFLAEGGTAPEAFVTGGTLDPGSAAPVPALVPSTMLLLVAGLAGLGAFRRKSRT